MKLSVNTNEIIVSSGDYFDNDITYLRSIIPINLWWNLIIRKMNRTSVIASNNPTWENVTQSMIYLLASIKSVTTLFIQIIA